MLLPILAATLIPLTSRHTPAVGPEVSRTIPATQRGCDGAVALRSLEFVADVEARSDHEISIDVHGVAVVEKLKKGAMAAPWFVLNMKKGGEAKTVVIALDGAMASPQWEHGGVMRQEFRPTDRIDAKFWESAELRCTTTSPFRATMIPEGVVYRNGDDATVAAAAHAIASKGVVALCDATVIGPDLYPAVKGDAALKIVDSPVIVMFSGEKKRSALRVKGPKECAAFGVALRNYVGTAPPRVRAATADELAHYWLNIGWDIEEPLFVLDYGAHRLVAELRDGTIFMIDEVSSSPSPPPSSRAAPGPGSR